MSELIKTSRSAAGPERVRVESVEWFPNDGASVYVSVVPVEEDPACSAH